MISLGVYWLLCKVSPIPATSDFWHEVDEDGMGGNNSVIYGINACDDEAGAPHEDVKKIPKIE